MEGKIKIMKTRPEMTDEQIRSYMDFDKLLEKHQQTSASRSIFRKPYMLALLFVVGTGSFTWFIIEKEQNTSDQVVSEQPSEIRLKQDEEVSAGDSLKNKKTAPTDLQKDEHKPVSKNENKKVEPGSELPSLKPNEAQNATPSGSASTKDSALSLVYVQASPVNGYPHLYEYFSRELTYPHEAMKDSLQGEVTAIFTINTDGVPEKILIENSLGPLFDQEVIRLITNMPPWKPAAYNDKPVASKISLPLTFQIKKIESQK